MMDLIDYTAKLNTFRHMQVYFSMKTKTVTSAGEKELASSQQMLSGSTVHPNSKALSEYKT